MHNVHESKVEDRRVRDLGKFFSSIEQALRNMPSVLVVGDICQAARSLLKVVASLNMLFIFSTD